MDLIRRLGWLLVPLLAVALTASGAMDPARVPAGGAVEDLAFATSVSGSGCGPATAGPMGGAKRHATHARPEGPRPGPCGQADAPGDHDRHESGHCSLCLIVHAVVDVPCPSLPPRALAARPVPRIALAAFLPPETHPRAPPARGPPVPVL